MKIRNIARTIKAIEKMSDKTWYEYGFLPGVVARVCGKYKWHYKVRQPPEDHPEFMAGLDRSGSVFDTCLVWQKFGIDEDLAHDLIVRDDFSKGQTVEALEHLIKHESLPKFWYDHETGWW